MNDRGALIGWLRGELMGPSRSLGKAEEVRFNAGVFDDALAKRRGPMKWGPEEDPDRQEVLYFDRETPGRKYGIGQLHPEGAAAGDRPGPAEAAAEVSTARDTDDDESGLGDDPAAEDGAEEVKDTVDLDLGDDFEVTSPDVRRPSSLGISFCARVRNGGTLTIRLPRSRRFAWQDEGDAPFALNGRYEKCERRWTNEDDVVQTGPMWRRRSAVTDGCAVTIEVGELVAGRRWSKGIAMHEGSPLALKLEVFPRRIQGDEAIWLLTVVLRNRTDVGDTGERQTRTLFQTYFEVEIDGGSLEPYPESQRPFDQLDHDEQSLALLYRESETWGIGHGCSAGWDCEPFGKPRVVYAEVFPAVQIPSMTPDIEDSEGNPIPLSMRELSSLPDDIHDVRWNPLRKLSQEYASWIGKREEEQRDLPESLRPVAGRHLQECRDCLGRIEVGIGLLETNPLVRKAFGLANLAMLLQQVAMRSLKPRELEWDAGARRVAPAGSSDNPWQVFEDGREGPGIGGWRAFQLAFLLMSLKGIVEEGSADREIVDLIWFPTGGGKTEAYLAVMAFFMFHERLLMDKNPAEARDGTNVLMRYTLRMLTTQQFQRAASLICGMEFIRRNAITKGLGDIPGRRFSLGLWIGGDGSPNWVRDARTEVNAFRAGSGDGNPLILTDCPWCRASIGRYKGDRPNVRPRLRDSDWKRLSVAGIKEVNSVPLLVCPDARCAFGAENSADWLPVEVIDERIYEVPPSLVIATADKLAMIAYRPKAGTLFGRDILDHGRRVSVPPGLIIQDELHLIAGPLGTMYAVYEGIIEELCSKANGGKRVGPKLIASTATIRGADAQVHSLYGRPRVQLFPSPGLSMGDSFFGKYARDCSGRLREGRLYLGIHATDYGSILTTQVRTFASALFRASCFEKNRRDPWWSLLVFYNSLRELGGAKTLFDSDIRSRLKFLFNREDTAFDDRRHLKVVEELTSRLAQSEIVQMLDRLAVCSDDPGGKAAIDACLASNIIEVGVDIDRLSLMGVVGQPKTTAQYIQVTGRVGRRWWDRPGLILMLYNPSKSRDRSHFEQFHGYHRRLYERVEPASATPFAIAAIRRGGAGALLAWARQQSDDRPVPDMDVYLEHVKEACRLLEARCAVVQTPEDRNRSLAEIELVRRDLERKWRRGPQAWEAFPPAPDGEYLMLWPGQFYTEAQKTRGVEVPTSMRQVDGSAELKITQTYDLETGTAKD